jgi:hypothetical protein
MVLSWPVDSVAEARKLASWGVDGLISSRFELLTAALAPGPWPVAA